MFSRMEVNQLFPSCVWLHEVAEAKAINARILEALEDVRRNEPSRSKTPGAYHSPADLHRREAFQPLSEVVTAAMRGVMDYLRVRYEGLTLTNLWANINEPGTPHHRHSHPNNFLSGVYYAKAEKGCGDITFADPRPQATVFSPRYAEYTPQNSSKFKFEAKPGLLLVFPAWLEHDVGANASNSERISFAFNAVPTGWVGQETGLVHIAPGS